MAVVSSTKDTEALTMTFVADLDAGVEKVWQVWEDPRKLERWWGPPMWPATFERHEFVAGGQVRYHMTGPEGQMAHGWWTITAIDAPRRLEFDDGFAGDDGEPLDPADVAHGIVTLEPVGSGTRMTVLSKFTSAEQLERMLGMGMEEGLRLSIGQIDAVLADA